MSTSTLKFQQYCSSRTFTILAGKDAVPFHVHSSLLLDKSSMFRSLINGKWSESEEGVVRWEEWEASVVASCVHFLYSNEYGTVEQMQSSRVSDFRRGLPSSTEQISSLIASNPRGTMTTGLNTGNAHQHPSTQADHESGSFDFEGLDDQRKFWAERFQELRTPLEPLNTPSTAYPETPASNTLLQSETALEAYRQLFIPALYHHVNVYALAQYADIPSLEDYAFQRFSETCDHVLKMIRWPPLTLAGAFVGVIEAVYDLTPQGRLRKLVTRVAVWKHKYFVIEREYSEALSKGGDFAVDLAMGLARKDRTIQKSKK